MIPLGQWLAQLPDGKTWPPARAADESTPDDSGSSTRERQIEVECSGGKVEAEADFDARLTAAETAARQKYAELLNIERQRWLREEAGPLAEKFGAAVKSLGLQLSCDVASVMRPFLAEAVREKALLEFNLMLESHIANSDSGIIRIRAPKDIVETIMPILPQGSPRYRLEEQDGCDVTVEAGSTIFVTQVGKWLAAIGVDSNGL